MRRIAAQALGLILADGALAAVPAVQVQVNPFAYKAKGKTWRPGSSATR
ncbi:hypothetical protein ABZ896_42790 [Streptomyces sp. NPDC047072]